MKKRPLGRKPVIYQNPHLKEICWQELCGEQALALPTAMPKQRGLKTKKHKTCNTHSLWKSLLRYAFFTLLLFFIFSALLSPKAFAASQLKLIAVTTGEDGGQIETTYTIDNSFGQDKKEVPDMPLLPAKTLSDICNVPISWHATEYGGTLIWGREAVAAVMMADQRYIYAVSGGLSEQPTIYEYELTEAPLLLGGTLYVPISLLPYMGIDYRLDAANNTIYLDLPASGYHTLTPEKIWPLVEKKVLEYEKPKNILLATATTSYNPKETNRTQNLLLSTEAIHGTVLKPNQTFSFNRIVGERTAKKGYKTAIVYSGKKKVPGIGGGICQVSTTTYQSARKAGLKITERHTHSLPVPYASSSNDATVAWGYLDLKFVNNTGASIYFVGKMKGGKLTIEIWQGELPKNLPDVYGIS